MSWWMMLYLNIYKKKTPEIEDKMKKNEKKLSRLDYQIKLIPEWNVFKVVFMFIYF